MSVGNLINIVQRCLCSVG